MVGGGEKNEATHLSWQHALIHQLRGGGLSGSFVEALPPVMCDFLPIFLFFFCRYNCSVLTESHLLRYGMPTVVGRSFSLLGFVSK